MFFAQKASIATGIYSMNHHRVHISLAFWLSLDMMPFFVFFRYKFTNVHVGDYMSCTVSLLYKCNWIANTRLAFTRGAETPLRILHYIAVVIGFCWLIQLQGSPIPVCCSMIDYQIKSEFLFQLEHVLDIMMNIVKTLSSAKHVKSGDFLRQSPYQQGRFKY